ncbi:hypothetical protein PFICI_03667 [Pestalotiopsis fici W106-1]|uniref:Glycoside hydrolase family 3 C-terminal domain-containing protein n=1 Tax=Pestalotiopsis fici (strain W106-1 / CGMCC3.15140) TaxID=1229662 RepID=W3XJK7_PESFW|nr:uncharacterized protein PFICI_03667 [Pestalotiopsis fici W106-1]ETS85642.1 hypothetical protein PFICI_03667 [Pestalotiopsis fici W106-1]
MQTLLREHWGWDQPYQWITSDCDAVNDVWEYHNYTADSITAAAAALNAGTDLACEGSIYNDLVQAISFNMTNEATVDRSVSRLYLSLMRLGFFDLKNSKYASLSWTDVDTSDARDLAKEAAVKGMTLMKNDGTLPLPASVASVALIGPYGNATTQMQGSYSGVAPYLVSPLMAMQAKWQNATYSLGTAINTEDSSNFSSAIELASASDYIIYCGGIDGCIEGQARDRTTISWPGNQLRLVGELSALGKPLVVVQFGGGQLDDSVLLANDSVSAIVWAGYPGQSGGDALVDLLDGTLAFAGRLPITQYPAHYVDETEMVDP